MGLRGYDITILLLKIIQNCYTSIKNLINYHFIIILNFIY